MVYDFVAAYAMVSLNKNHVTQMHSLHHEIDPEIGFQKLLYQNIYTNNDEPRQKYPLNRKRSWNRSLVTY